ncbi:hypothetical protein DM01DRAFT_1395118 [Hesseltinella vesiculosa]|uniref:TLC domain-containing protein n=1 Tax=Hesseltinella vesiculosa TaxID=101127 RepID=A0A1X2GTN9_9FUNG|nr:hypothetical protein DM01DRAFT_1395118 [Hesseltinella vesiculosa]
MTSYYHIGNKLTLLQVMSQPVVPVSLLLGFVGLATYFFFCIRMGWAKTEKEISWLLTFASSVVCTVVSIPYYIRFWRSGWDMQLLGVDATVHTSLACFFMTYLVLDLVLGCRYYRQKITIATGWIHHTIYIVILFWLMRCRSTSFFTVNAILELPTVILAVGSMRASWRSDFLFASTFLALRLVYHAWMIVAVKQYHRLESLWTVAVLVFPLHVYWFYGIAQIQYQRFKAMYVTAKNKMSDSSSPVSSPLSSPRLNEKPVALGSIRHHPDCLCTCASHANGLLLSSASSSASSSSDEEDAHAKQKAMSAFRQRQRQRPEEAKSDIYVHPMSGKPMIASAKLRRTKPKHLRFFDKMVAV